MRELYRDLQRRALKVVPHDGASDEENLRYLRLYRELTSVLEYAIQIGVSLPPADPRVIGAKVFTLDDQRHGILAAKPLPRSKYAAVLHQRVDPPLQALVDTFYLFTADRRSLRWATARTRKAQVDARAAARRLAGLYPPHRVARQHIRIVKALRRLDHDLDFPIKASHRGREPVLQWWLQKFGSLPELLALNNLHASLSTAGYWK